MSRIKGAKPSAALLVAVVALVVALGGGAVAGVAVTVLNNKEKKEVRKLARKQANKRIDKREPGLDVNSAKSAETAASALNADVAATAANAETLEGKESSEFLGATDKAVDSELIDGIDSPVLVQTARSDIPGQTSGGPVGSTVRQLDFRASNANQNLWYLGTLRWTFQCNGTNLTAIRVFNTDPVEARVWIRWAEGGSSDANVETLAVSDSSSIAVMSGFTDDAVVDFSYVNANGMQVTGSFHASDSSGGTLSGLGCMVGGTATVTP